MLAFLFRRLLQAVFVMITISIISFSIQGKLGDPVQQMVGVTTSPSERAHLRDQLGLDQSIADQYWHYVRNALHGDFGTSYYYKKPVLTLILEKLPATFELAFCAIVIIAFIATPLGILAAIRPRNIVSRLTMAFSTLGLSVPIFIMGIFLVYVFSIQLHLTPSFGRGQTVMIFDVWRSGLFTKDGLRHLMLPSFTLAFALLPIFIRLIRSEMVEVLQSEYIRFAWSKGLSTNRIYFVHALKNTMLPVITVGGIQAGTLVAYTILTESIFQWPGMGFLFMNAVAQVDTPLISAYLMVVGAIFVIANTIVDLIYGLVNPTVKLANHGL